MEEKKYVKKLFGTFLLLLFGFFINAQSNWQFRKELNGTKAYTSNVEDSKILAYRIEGKLNTTLNNIVALFHDDTAYTTIFRDTKEAYFTKEEGELIRHWYYRINAPWPAKDRDCVIENIYSYDPDLQSVYISGKCIDEGYPSGQKTIQIQNCFGYWRFTRITETELDIEYQFFADPRGIVPAWLINKQTIDGPLDTFKKIKEIVNHPKYQNQEFDFLKTK